MVSGNLGSGVTHRFARLTALMAVALLFATGFAAVADEGPANDAATRVAQPAAAQAAAGQHDEASVPLKTGVLLNDARACPGYNLINPGRKQTYLFDNEGRVVHAWTSEHSSGAAAYLLDNGHLFRPAEATHRKPGFQGPAAGGRIQEFDWDGNLVWDFEYHSEQRLPHHDAIKLPNGNALLICWERIDEQTAIAAGRRPETVKDSHLQPDCLVEIKPTGLTTGEIVWEWRSWDHLIQDFDDTKSNFGIVAEHPELFDLNYLRREEDQAAKPAAPQQAQPTAPQEGQTTAPQEATAPPENKDASPDLPPNAPPQDAPKKDPAPVARPNPDWMHVNAVAYNAELDQIALSSPHFDEIWIIDHSTTTEEAQGHSGGRWGKGGDILYRWGNPRAYGRGTPADQRLFFQHNIQWIPKGMRGEGHLLVFNNGAGRRPEEYSSVDEFVPPTDSNGNYVCAEHGTFGPDAPLWSYSAPQKKDFYSWFISGAQRLPNGNTLINSGAVGIVFEVTPEMEIVWKFSNPFKRVMGPPPAGGGPPNRFEVFNRDVRNSLGLTDEQRKQLDEIDKALMAKLETILTAEQIKSLAEPNPSDFANFSKIPAGEYLAVFNRPTLQLTEGQRAELQALQTEFNPQITKVLTDAQKTMVADFKKAQFAPPAGRDARPRGNTLFRATRYALDHPAFAGRTLQPGKTLVEIEAEFDQQQAAAAAAPANTAGDAK